MSEADTKPDLSSTATDEHLNLKVKNSDGAEVFFKVRLLRRTSALGTVD